MKWSLDGPFQNYIQGREKTFNMAANTKNILLYFKLIYCQNKNMTRDLRQKRNAQDVKTSSRLKLSNKFLKELLLFMLTVFPIFALLSNILKN